jgi:hypothetical protein
MNWYSHRLQDKLRRGLDVPEDDDDAVNLDKAMDEYEAALL